MSEDLGARARSIGALADDLRRRMYLFIRESRDPVSREQAAQAVGITAKLAAFHLDKLVDEGLLAAHYARLPGRGGPGAGRSSKLYEPTDRSIDVSIPPKAYDFVGKILLDALESKRDDESAEAAARRVGHEAGAVAGRAAGGRSGRGTDKTLRELGFEPRREGDRILLNNCPFHALAQANPGLVCGMNEAFVAGVIEGTGETNRRAVLDPEEGRCCVTLEEARTV